MVISGLRYREIYPQEEFSWDLSLIDIPTTGSTDFRFYFSGQNQALFEIFSIKNKKIYSQNNEFIDGYSINNSLIRLSGEINKNYYSLYSNGTLLFQGRERTGSFGETLIQGFVFNSFKENFIDFNSLQILGERPEYYIDTSKNFLFSTIDFPINIFNSGDYDFKIYSGASLDSAFSISLPNDFVVPANGQTFFTVNNLRLLNGYRSVPIILYSEFGTLNFNLELSGIKIDESTYYLRFGPQQQRIINNNSYENYGINAYNVNSANLVIELKHVSGVTGNYKPPRNVTNQFNSGDKIFTNLGQYNFKQKISSGSNLATNIGTPYETAVALNNDATILMMGGVGDDPNGVMDAGSALIFTGNVQAGWILKQKLTGDGLNSYFGDSLATNSDGTVLMMGGFGDDPNGVLNAGAALIYTGNAINGWALKQKITGDSANDQFGSSIAINSDGTVLMMGGVGDDPNGVLDAGAALIYTGNAINGWDLKQKITGDSANDQFGSSIAINSDGTVLMMGGVGDDPNGVLNAGAALIYTGNATNGWVVKQKITGDNINDQFGSSVAINSEGTVLVMGGFGDDPNGVLNAGAALIYTGNAINGWDLKQKITGDSANDQFGSSIAINGDGTVLIIGKLYDDPNGVLNAGAALIYTGNAVNGWALKQKITGDKTDSYFGQTVATNSDGTVVMMGGYDYILGENSQIHSTIIFSSFTEKIVKDILVSGYITGSGFLYSNINGIISYFNPLNNEIETGLGEGLAAGFKIAEPAPLPPIQLLQNLIGSGNFGFSSTFIGDSLYIGSPKNSLLENGYVSIFKGNAINGFSFIESIVNPDLENTGDQFGFSVYSNIDNNRLFIGGPFDSISGITGGAVWIYSKGARNSNYIFREKITGKNYSSDIFNISGNCFGYTIKSNLSGDRLFISSLNDNNGKGSINFYRTSLNSIRNNGIYEKYVFQNTITGLNYDLSLKNFGKYIYTNQLGNLLLTSDSRYVYIFKEQDLEWSLHQSILTHPFSSFDNDPYFYANSDCSIIGYFSENLGSYLNIITGNANSNWVNLISNFSDGFINTDKKFIFNNNASLLYIFDETGIAIYTGLNDNSLRNTENIVNIYNPNGNIISSHDGTLIGFQSGQNGFNLYNYYPLNFVSFNYIVTLTGIGDAELFTDIPAKAYVSGIEYAGPVTFLGGFLTGIYSTIGSGVQRDDYYGWTHNANGILVPPAQLNQSSLDLICRFLPNLSICRDRVDPDAGRPIITGLMSGVNTKFVNYTGIIYADYTPDQLTTANLQSPLVAFTGRLTGFFDIFGFAVASGIPGQVSGKILGDFAQYFEPGSWTITKPWFGAVSGRELVNLFNEDAFSPVTLQIRKNYTSGYIFTGLRQDLFFQDFCTEELLKFPGVFEVSGAIPPFVREYRPIKEGVPLDPRIHFFGKQPFAVAPILSGYEWPLDTSSFQLESGLIFINSGIPNGGRTRISRLGITLSGSGSFKNVFQLPLVGDEKGKNNYIGVDLNLEDPVGTISDYKIHKTDFSGNLLYFQQLDFLGNPDFKKKKKCKIVRYANGDPIFDDNGEPISILIDPVKFVSAFNEEGNPIFDSNGSPSLVPDCEAEVDENGFTIIDFYYKDEIVNYENLTTGISGYYLNLSGLRINRNEDFYLNFNGVLTNYKIYWEAAFEENGIWKRFDLVDNANELINEISSDMPIIFDGTVYGKIPFGLNYLRVKAEKIDNLLPSNIVFLNFSGVKKSKIPIILPDFYEISNPFEQAGWREKLSTLKETLYETGAPPCIEIIRAPAFFFDPCDSTYFNLKVIKPTFYISGQPQLDSCFEKCFSLWPRLNSTINRDVLFSGYSSSFIQEASFDNPIKIGICDIEQSKEKRKYFEIISGCCGGIISSSSSSSSQTVSSSSSSLSSSSSSSSLSSSSSSSIAGGLTLRILTSGVGSTTSLYNMSNINISTDSENPTFIENPSGINIHTNVNGINPSTFLYLKSNTQTVPLQKLTGIRVQDLTWPDLNYIGEFAIDSGDRWTAGELTSEMLARTYFTVFQENRLVFDSSFQGNYVMRLKLIYYPQNSSSSSIGGGTSSSSSSSSSADSSSSSLDPLPSSSSSSSSSSSDGGGDLPPDSCSSPYSSGSGVCCYISQSNMCCSEPTNQYNNGLPNLSTLLAQLGGNPNLGFCTSDLTCAECLNVGGFLAGLSPNQNVQGSESYSTGCTNALCVNNAFATGLCPPNLETEVPGEFLNPNECPTNLCQSIMTGLAPSFDPSISYNTQVCCRFPWSFCCSGLIVTGTCIDRTASAGGDDTRVMRCEDCLTQGGEILGTGSCFPFLLDPLCGTTNDPSITGPCIDNGDSLDDLRCKKEPYFYGPGSQGVGLAFIDEILQSL
jgi:hypothetical protein